MSDEEKKPAPLISAITDHSPEGIEILYSEPSRVIRAFNLLILALVVAGGDDPGERLRWVRHLKTLNRFYPDL